jgi:hypothetical protein
MSILCSQCGEKSDRGMIQRCRGCTPLSPVQYLGESTSGPVIRIYRVSLSDESLLSLMDLHKAKRRILEWKRNGSFGVM